MQQLNIQDAGFIYQETRKTPMHISGLGVFDQSTSKHKRMNKAEVVAYIEERIHLAPILKKRLKKVPYDLERPYWVDDPKFDLRNHVFQLALPEPGNKQQLSELVSYLITQPLDMRKPLWEVYLIEGLNDFDGVGKGSFAMLTKIHHSCVDGASGNHLFAALVDLVPNAEPRQATEPGLEDEKMPGRYQMLAQAYLHNLTGAVEQTLAVSRRLPKLVKMGVELWQGKRDAGAKLVVPMTRFNRTPDRERAFGFTTYDLATIKAIKNAAGTTVNDVMVCIVAGALRRFLEHYGELPEQALGAMLPKNIRQGDEKNLQNGNRVGGLFVTMHTDIADAAERLLAINNSTQKAKQFSDDADTDAIFPSLMGGFLYPRAGKAFARMTQRYHLMERLGPMVLNTVITNVAGPDLDLYHAGARQYCFCGLPPLIDGVGISHAVYSSQGKVTLAVVSCPQMIDDAEFYMQCCQDSFDELVEAFPDED